jgi:hypothetical protein
MTGAVMREPRLLGFAVLSPWLVTWQQIFSPTLIKLGTTELPVWPFYTALYLLIGLLFVFWGRNALDSRKLERNPWVRLLSLVLANGYLAVAVLCMRSYGTLSRSTLNGFFDWILAILVVALPFFTMGTMTDRDQVRFRNRPVLESLKLSNLFMNHPATGIFFLMLLIATVTLTLWLTSGWPWKLISEEIIKPYVWILPWFLIFIAMRLTGFRARGLFIGYLLGTVLFSILNVFSAEKTASNTFNEFFLGQPPLILLWIAGMIYFFLAWLIGKKRNAVPSAADVSL